MKTLFDTVDRLQGALGTQRERHLVLSGNLANIDTPGYRPLDLLQKGPLAAAEEPVQTDPAHLGAGGVAGTELVFTDDVSSVTPDGNGVSLERELAKVDANRVRYEASARLVSQRLALLRYGAGDGNG